MRSTLLLGCVALACTEAEVYSQNGDVPIAPDRLAITGELCTEDTSGAKFPTRVLIAMDASARMGRADPDGYRFSRPGAGLVSFIDRYDQQPHVRFGFMALRDTPRAAPSQEFFPATSTVEIDSALNELSLAQGLDLNLLDAITQVEAFITTDMSRASPGATLRTRYIVYFYLAGPPVPASQIDSLAAELARVRDVILGQGALELRVHFGFLYYGPGTIDPARNNCYPAPATPCACDGSDTDPYCVPDCDPSLTEPPNDTARDLYEDLAFLAGGRFREFPCSYQGDFSIEVSSGSIELVKKDIAAYNTNVVLGPNGTQTDSDGDGLADLEEVRASPNTDPNDWDTDGDGIGDRLEFRMVPEQDPTSASDRPTSCVDPAGAPALPDSDLDLFNDCEEGLMLTSPSIPDTDGDGLPDLLEFLGGTVPTSPEDRLMDFDGDGVSNAREVLEHTNPRAHEGELRGIEAYRNNINFVAERPVATMARAPELPGINFHVASANVSGGQAYLRWRPCDGTLEWVDAKLNNAPPYLPVPVDIGDSGVYRLTAQAQNGEEIWVEVFVSVENLPECDEAVETIARPLISVSDRNCYDVRISNIKLHETEAANGDEAGLNRILVFFTQGPSDRLSAPGISQVAEVRVGFECPSGPSSCQRSIPDGLVILHDSDFVSVVP